MDKALVVLDDGQEIDVAIREFEVTHSLFSKPEITFSGIVTGRHSGTLKFEVTKVIFNNPATVVFWSDGTKTVVKCSKNDKFDPEIGLAMAVCKKAFGNIGAYNEVFKKWVPRRNTDTMRDKLSEYCNGRLCYECPLDAPVSRCGCGYFFTIPKGKNGYMSDDEIVDAYKRVFGK